MSVSESELVEEYWQRVGGHFIDEFKAVQRGDTNGHRYLEAVIIKNKEKERLDSYSAVQFDGEDVIVVQCKTKRLGMYLMGQAYFSITARSLESTQIKEGTLNRFG